jgi:GTPase SAR1 family protein
MKSILCPFCFTKFNIQDVLFRCSNINCTDRTVDKVYDKFHALKSTSFGPMGRLFSPDTKPINRAFSFLNPPKEASCPTCDRKTNKRICPTCHSEQVYDPGTAREEIIAVIGGRSTGKSCYIAVLIQRLKNEFGQDFDASLMAIGDGTRTRYENDFYKPIFKDNKVIQPTQSGGTDASVKSPMVFRITINNQGKTRAINLVLFDTAGEDMRSLDSMSAEARYILYSDAIIFLLDPLQIESVREQLAGSNLPPFIEDAAPTPIVERLYELHEKQLGMKGNEKIKKPIAFTLAKIDTLFPIIDPGSVLHYASNHPGYLNLKDIQSVHTEISTYLQSWLGLNFNNIVKTQFQNYKYFGISAFGKPPIDDKTLNGVSPLRVEDPFLWILHELSLIKSKK